MAGTMQQVRASLVVYLHCSKMVGKGNRRMKAADVSASRGYSASRRADGVVRPSA